MYNGMELSFLTAHQIPFLVFHHILHYLDLSPLLSSLLFIYIFILIAHLSMYSLAKYILETKTDTANAGNTEFISIVAAVLYGLSPYNIGIIAPGHILQLIIIAFAPAIFLYIDQIFTSKTFSIRPFLYLFLFFFFSSSAFANIGIIYIALIFIGTIFVALTIKTDYFFKHIPRFIGVIAILFLSNIWWLLPFLARIEKTIAINETSTEINAALESASIHASILNIFLGRPENMFYLFKTSYYTNFFAVFIFFILSVLMFYSLNVAKKNRYIWRLGFIAVIGLFVTKAIHPPFSIVFEYLYQNFPGFQIFRRPVSKFYWVFLLVQILLASIGLKFFLDKRKQNLVRNVLRIVAIGICAYLWVAFVQTKPLTNFNIPNYYYDARTHLENEKVNKVVVLPTFSGKQPTFNTQLNTYYGEDFLEYIWKFGILKPDPTTYSPNLPYKPYLTSLEKHIESESSFCLNSKNLGVTHIVLRNDVNGVVADKDPQIYLKKLSDHNDISHIKTFGNNDLIVYTVSPQCAGFKNVLVNDTAQTDYQLINPSKYLISLRNVSPEATIELLNNYDKSWKLYPSQEDVSSQHNRNQYSVSNTLLSFADIQYLWKKPVSDNHIKTRGFANGWKLDLKQIREEDKGSIKKNSDGTYDMNIVIYYTLQTYSYIGLLISAASAIILVGWCYSERNNLSKCRK